MNKKPLPVIVFIGESTLGISESIKPLSSYEHIFFASLSEARKWLYRKLLNAEQHPDVIVCDASMEETQIINFIKNISFNDSIKSIPFILYAKNGLSFQKKELIKKIKEVDDLYEVSIAAEKFVARISFLRIFKKKKLSYVPETETQAVPKPEILFNKILKRALDILVSSLLLVFLSPLFLIIAIVIKLESKGPILYRASRAGSNYKIFKFYKFRTMVVNAEALMQQISHMNQYGATEGLKPVFIKIQNDPRVTKVGLFLRNTSLDELPQLINVLKGEMSLVGNRPLPLYEAASLTKDQWAGRFLAPAGITGLWQISKRGKKDMDYTERIDLDINYADKHSFFYDLWILMKTPRALIQKENV